MGFQDLLDIPYYANLWADSSNVAKVSRAPYEDLTSRAFFVQAGYRIPVQAGQISEVQPYVQYQWWDQAANLDGDYRTAHLTVGLNMRLGPAHTRLKLDYQSCLAFAEEGALPAYGESAQADRFLVRLQIGF